MSKLLEKARSYETEKIAVTDKNTKPLFHISAPAGWINDPNGFSVYNGKIHLFYQYYPYLREWGPMHWGHSTTNDMIKWEQLECALAPDEEYDKIGCFSGSAIEADGKHVLVYTGVTKIKMPDGSEQERQNQCIAFGDGLNYEKYENNPVVTGDMLPENCSRIDFRDPKIWKEDDTYYLIVGSKDLNDVGQVVLCSSKNLTDWQGMMTLPRELEIKDGRIWQKPVREIENYRTNKCHYTDKKIDCYTTFEGIKGRTLDMTVELSGEEYNNFTVEVACDDEYSTAFTYNRGAGILDIDRTYCGVTKDVVCVRKIKIADTDRKLKLRFIMDRQSIELFINDGQQVATTAICTPLQADGICFNCDGSAVVNIEKYDILDFLTIKKEV